MNKDAISWYKLFHEIVCQGQNLNDIMTDFVKKIDKLGSYERISLNPIDRFGNWELIFKWKTDFYKLSFITDSMNGQFSFDTSELRKVIRKEKTEYYYE